MGGGGGITRKTRVGGAETLTVTNNHPEMKSEIAQGNWEGCVFRKAKISL